jgi:hypothetical protein
MQFAVVESFEGFMGFFKSQHCMATFKNVRENSALRYHLIARRIHSFRIGKKLPIVSRGMEWLLNPIYQERFDSLTICVMPCGQQLNETIALQLFVVIQNVFI